MEISLANQQQALAVDEQQLIEVTRQIVSDAGITGGALSLAVVDDVAMHALNRRHLAHDYPTDVLSFALEERAGYLEGEIIVSAETAARNANEYGQSPADELLLYVVHGALHLVGYNDKSPSEELAMREAEARYLRQYGSPYAATVPISSAGERST